MLDKLLKTKIISKKKKVKKKEIKRKKGLTFLVGMRSIRLVPKTTKHRNGETLLYKVALTFLEAL
jgi:hypothetical protein